MAEPISSLQNHRVKNIVRLQEKSSERRSQNLFVVEGLRELGLALGSGYKIQQLYVCHELMPTALEFNAQELFEVSKEVFSKIAYRENSDGVVALLEPKFYQLNQFIAIDNPFYIVLEAVEKPGNLGAILRTADAAQVTAVIVCDPKTDLFNPNVIRSSVGCAFTVPTIVASSETVLEFFRDQKISAYAAALTASEEYTQIDFTQGSAVIMGTEADGLSDYWLSNADLQIKIPMLGKIDSLNVATSTAILTFEALRQRRS